LPNLSLQLRRLQWLEKRDPVVQVRDAAKQARAKIRTK
jgi:hypothetical protein